MNETTIVNYGAGNIGSVANMIKRVGGKAFIASSPQELEKAERIILPGVGSFDSGMGKLEASGMIEMLNKKVLVEKVPFLGICLGAQLCTKGSEEGTSKGLGWFDADTLKFKFNKEQNLKLPHMGWNYVKACKEHPILNELPQNSRFYFVHKYYLQAQNKQDILFSSEYGSTFASGLQKDNIIALQFHPEKSHKYGMRVMENFINL